MNGGAFTIREGRPEDSAAVGEIFALTFPDKFGPPLGGSVAHQAEIIAELPPGGPWWVAEMGGRVAGVVTLHLGDQDGAEVSAWRILRRHCSVWRSLWALVMLQMITTTTADEHTAYVDMLGVHPDFQGKGIGEALLRHAVEAARQYGKDEVALHCLKKNERAHRVYVRVGFKQKRVQHAPWLIPFFGFGEWVYMVMPLKG